MGEELILPLSGLGERFPLTRISHLSPPLTSSIHALPVNLVKMYSRDAIRGTQYLQPPLYWNIEHIINTAARLNNNAIHARQKWYQTHEASKFWFPLRSASLLPCPADQFSTILKSVHWYHSNPMFPKQPLRQSTEPDPSKYPVDTVLALQSPPTVEFLLQAIRWVNRTYMC